MKRQFRISSAVIVALIFGTLIGVEIATAAVGNNVGNEAPDFSLPDINNFLTVLYIAARRAATVFR